jgi:hypothetical protein
MNSANIDGLTIKVPGIEVNAVGQTAVILVATIRLIYLISKILLIWRNRNRDSQQR